MKKSKILKLVQIVMIIVIILQIFSALFPNSIVNADSSIFETAKNFDEMGSNGLSTSGVDTDKIGETIGKPLGLLRAAFLAVSIVAILWLAFKGAMGGATGQSEAKKQLPWVIGIIIIGVCGATIIQLVSDFGDFMVS